MHKIKIGEFKFLAIAILDQEEDYEMHLFFDKSEQAAAWFVDAMVKNNMNAPILNTYGDVNHLLNKMVKAKGTKAGEAMYSVYMANYPDDEQKTKVIEFWKEKNNT